MKCLVMVSLIMGALQLQHNASL